MSDTGCMKSDGDSNIFLGGKVTCQPQAVSSQLGTATCFWWNSDMPKP